MVRNVLKKMRLMSMLGAFAAGAALMGCGEIESLRGVHAETTEYTSRAPAREEPTSFTVPEQEEPTEVTRPTQAEPTEVVTRSTQAEPAEVTRATQAEPTEVTAQEQEANGTYISAADEPTEQPVSSIEILGDEAFVERTNQALALLRDVSPEHFELVETYVGLIEPGRRPSMAPFADPPIMRICDGTTGASLEWFAGVLVHEAYHSKLFHGHLHRNGFLNSREYAVANGGHGVPFVVWGGEEAELKCLAAQLDFLKMADVPQLYIDQIGSMKAFVKSPEWWGRW